MQHQRSIGQASGLSDAARSRFLALEGRPPLVSDWLDTVMIHYECDAGELQRDVPFELDLFEGRAFVSLVAFTMTNLRTRRWPRLGRRLLAPIGTHAFLNVRTYVCVGGEFGIYFLAEYLPNRLSVALGPPLYGLPYQFGRLAFHHDQSARTLTGVVEARATGSLSEGVRELKRPIRAKHTQKSQTQDCTSTALRSSFVLGSRRSLFQSGDGRSCDVELSDKLSVSPSVRPRLDTSEPGEQLDRHRAERSSAAEQPTQTRSALRRLHYEVTRDPHAPFEPATTGSLTEFLMERYTAYTKWNGIIRRFRIWHSPWPQRSATAEIIDYSLLDSTGCWQRSATLHSANESPGVHDVWMGRPRLIRPMPFRAATQNQRG